MAQTKEEMRAARRLAFDHEVERWMRGERADENLIGEHLLRLGTYAASRWRGPQVDREAMGVEAAGRVWESLKNRRERGETQPPAGCTDWDHLAWVEVRSKLGKGHEAGDSRYVREARKLIKEVEDEIDQGRLPASTDILDAAHERGQKKIGGSHFAQAATVPFDDSFAVTAVDQSLDPASSTLALSEEDAVVIEDEIDRARRRGWQTGDEWPEKVAERLEARGLFEEWEERRLTALAGRLERENRLRARLDEARLQPTKNALQLDIFSVAAEQPPSLAL